MIRTAEIEIDMVTTYDQEATPLDYLFKTRNIAKRTMPASRRGAMTSGTSSGSAPGPP